MGPPTRGSGIYLNSNTPQEPFQRTLNLRSMATCSHVSWRLYISTSWPYVTREFLMQETALLGPALYTITMAVAGGTLCSLALQDLIGPETIALRLRRPSCFGSWKQYKLSTATEASLPQDAANPGPSGIFHMQEKVASPVLGALSGAMVLV